MNSSTGDWFRTTVGVRQWCLLSPPSSISFSNRLWCSGRPWWKDWHRRQNITNLLFASNVDAPAEEERELAALFVSLGKICTKYKMEISAGKTKLMTNSANGIQRKIKVKGQKLDTITSFIYLWAVISDEGSKLEVLSKIAQATAALTLLKTTWRDNNSSLRSNVKLVRSLVISVFSYALWIMDLASRATGGRNPLRWHTTEGYSTFRTKTIL